MGSSSGCQRSGSPQHEAVIVAIASTRSLPLLHGKAIYESKSWVVLPDILNAYGMAMCTPEDTMEDRKSSYGDHFHSLRG